MLKKKGFTLENKNISLLRRSNRWGWTALSIALCMLLSPLLAVSVFIPQGMTLVPIALLLLVGYVGPVSAATCTAILVTLSTVFFGFWGAALSAVLLVPILVVSSYMVEHEQSFWQSAAGSGVTMFASIGLAMLLVSALAGADVVTALSNIASGVLGLADVQRHGADDDAAARRDHVGERRRSGYCDAGCGGARAAD